METPFDFEAVWMTSGNRGAPHDAALRNSNPGLTIYTHTSAESGMDGWRNCDRGIRDWWVSNREATAAGNFLFLEYDVLVKTDMREMFPRLKPLIVVGCSLKTMVKDGRSSPPLKEAWKLPPKMHPYAIALVPFAILMLSREALDEMASPENDALYQADIFNEMRTPTLLRFKGFTIQGNPRLSHITATTIPYPSGESGIWHAVKTGGQNE